ncbi:MAG: PASTA domain-containing protein [Candidatus Zixiibacteriota bacterium]|nr:MAG: PASTA domain-containing protein [candidate division Zixibacteria bacterium]
MTISASRRKKKIESSFARLFPNKSLQRRLLYYVITPILALFCLYTIINNIVMPLITRHGAEFELPGITDYQQQDAEYLLSKLGLRLEVTSEEYHPDKAEGTVLTQYPAAGTRVKSGRIIKVMISFGQKLVAIPALAGFSVRQAKLNIEAAGLILGDIAWTFSDSLPERVVVFSYPPSGTEIPIGAQVNLMVNRGRLSGIVYMPRLVGRPFNEADSLLQELGLVIGLVSHIRNENYLPGTVLEQSVEEATELEVGEEIDLIVSTTE